MNERLENLKNSHGKQEDEMPKTNDESLKLMVELTKRISELEKQFKILLK